MKNWNYVLKQEDISCELNNGKDNGIIETYEQQTCATDILNRKGKGGIIPFTEPKNE